MNARWLFLCSCIALVTSAFTFIVRGDVLKEVGDTFSLTQEQRGSMEGAVFLGMALSMFVGGFICDALGMKRIMILAFLSHLLGALGSIYPKAGIGFLETNLGLKEMTFPWLYYASMLMGFGNGFTEVAINPLVASLYPKEKTHYLNILHAWWPGGLMIGGVLVRYLGKGIDLGFVSIDGMHLQTANLAGWQVSLYLIAIPAVIYGIMLIPARFPQTERVESGVSAGQMLQEAFRPLFLLWAFCMLLTAATELGPQKWQESVMMQTTQGKVSGTLILVYTSGMMFVLRHFAGPIANRLSPVGMMTGSAILSAVGLYLLSYANNTATAFGYATIYGLGIAYFWPTMLGVAAERFPRGGALILALMGTAGNISISYVQPAMGRIYDTQRDKVIMEAILEAKNLPAVVVREKFEKSDLATALTAADQAIHALEEAHAGGNGSAPGMLAALVDNNAAQDQIGTHLLPLIVDAKSKKAVTAERMKTSMETETSYFYTVASNAAAVDALRAPIGALVEPLRKLGVDVNDADAAYKAVTETYPNASSLIEAYNKKSAIKLADTENKDETKQKAGKKQLEEIEAAYSQAADKKHWERFAKLQEAERTGAALSFRYVTVLPAALIVLFSLIYLYDLSRGGYKAESIGGGHH